MLGNRHDRFLPTIWFTRFPITFIYSSTSFIPLGKIYGLEEMFRYNSLWIRLMNIRENMNILSSHGSEAPTSHPLLRAKTASWWTKRVWESQIMSCLTNFDIAKLCERGETAFSLMLEVFNPSYCVQLFFCGTHGDICTHRLISWFSTNSLVAQSSISHVEHWSQTHKFYRCVIHEERNLGNFLSSFYRKNQRVMIDRRKSSIFTPLNVGNTER